MREQLEKRLRELRAEFESGQRMLADLEQQRLNLEKTLLRISGAIQVLEEELAKDSPGESPTDELIAVESTAGVDGYHLSVQETGS